MVAAAANGFCFGELNSKRNVACAAPSRIKTSPPRSGGASPVNNYSRLPASYENGYSSVKRRKHCGSAAWVNSSTTNHNNVMNSTSLSSSNSSPRRRRRNVIGGGGISGLNHHNNRDLVAPSVRSYEGIRTLLVADAFSTNFPTTCIVFIYFVPAVVSILCYLNSLSGDFVHDDIMAVTTNQDVLGKTGLVNVFQNDFWGKPMNDNTSHKSYRPLTILTFRFNYILGGLEPNGFHVINVILHTLVVLLFTCVCRRCLLWPNHITLTASLLMASHPIHTEAVAGIVGRADVLACALSMLSFLFYTRSLEHEKLKIASLAPPNSIYFYMSFVLASLAMLAKEHGVTVLAIVASYDLFVSEKKIRRAIKNWIVIRECYPFITRLAITVFVTLILVTFRIWMLDGTIPQFSEQDNPTSFAVLWQTRFLTYAYLLAFNAWLLLGPITMSYDWQLGSIPLIESVWDVRNLSTLLLMVAVLLLLWRVVVSHERESDKRAMYLGLLFIIFPFFPASNLFVTVGFVVAERILYFPSIGFCILIAHGFHKLLNHKKLRCFAIWSLIILVVVFTTKTLLRNRVWSSREALFRSGLITLPHNAKMHYNFANLQNDLGNIQEAIEHYKETLRLWPEHASAQNNLGTLVEDPLVAKFHFMEAIRINPNHARAHFNMGNLLSKESQMSAAIRFMEQAVLLEPTYTDAYTNLAAMYSEVGRLEDAERVHRSLLQLEPDSADVHNNYGAFLQKIGRKDESLKSYRQSTIIQPDHVVALVNTAKLLRSMKKNVEAEEIYKRVMEMKEDSKVMDSLGVLYLSTGRYKEAKSMFTEIIKKFPDELDSRVHFAQIHTHEMNFAEAEEMLQWVLSRNDSHRDGLRQMALLCNHLNRTTEALDYILRALKLCSITDVACAQLYADHATILMDRDHMDLAMESYKMALQVYPSFTLAHLNLGVIYHIKRDFTQAWNHYKTAQVLEPNNRLLQENMDKLRKAEIAFMSSSEHSDSCR